MWLFVTIKNKQTKFWHFPRIMGPLSCIHLPQKYHVCGISEYHRNTTCPPLFLGPLSFVFPSMFWELLTESGKEIYIGTFWVLETCCYLSQVSETPVSQWFFISYLLLHNNPKISSECYIYYLTLFGRLECGNSLAQWIWLSISDDGAVRFRLQSWMELRVCFQDGSLTCLLALFLTELAVPCNVTVGFPQNEWSMREYP